METEQKSSSSRVRTHPGHAIDSQLILEPMLYAVIEEESVEGQEKEGPGQKDPTNVQKENVDQDARVEPRPDPTGAREDERVNSGRQPTSPNPDISDPNEFGPT